MANAKTRKATAKKSITKPRTAVPRNTAAKTGSKSEAVLAMLAGEGSTIEAMTKKLGWQPHTLRAFLSRLAKTAGLKIERSRAEGVTSYRIAG